MKKYTVLIVLFISAILFAIGVIAADLFHVESLDVCSLQSDRQGPCMASTAFQMQSVEIYLQYCSNDILSRALNRSHDTNQPRIFRPVLFFRWSDPLREEQFFRANFDHPADSCLQLLVWLSPHLKARADPLVCEYSQCLSV